MDAGAGERLSSCYALFNPVANAQSRPMKAEKQGTAARANSPGVGFLLLDAARDPIYANDEAVRILAYPKGPREVGSLDGFLAEKIRSVLFDNHSLLSPPLTEILSGRRHYRCQAFSVESHLRGPSHTTAVVFERRPRRVVDVAQIATKFQLTGREAQTVGFLVEGLTSKEIAGHMNIRPNTVKAFIRLVMVKMGVSTRAGIVGKIVKTVSKSNQAPALVIGDKPPLTVRPNGDNGRSLPR